MPASTSRSAARFDSFSVPDSLPPSYTSRPVTERAQRKAPRGDAPVVVEAASDAAWEHFRSHLEQTGPARPAAAARRKPKECALHMGDMHAANVSLTPAPPFVPARATVKLLEPFSFLDAAPVAPAPAPARRCGSPWLWLIGVGICGGVVAGAVLGSRAAHNNEAATFAPTTTFGAPTATSTATSRPVASPTSSAYAGLAPGLYQLFGSRQSDTCSDAGWGFSCGYTFSRNLSFSGQTNAYQVQDVSQNLSLSPQAQDEAGHLLLLSPFVDVTTPSGCAFHQQISFDLEITGAGEFAQSTTFRLSNAQTGVCADVLPRLTQVDQVSCACTYLGGSRAVG